MLFDLLSIINMPLRMPRFKYMHQLFFLALLTRLYAKNSARKSLYGLVLNQ